MHMVIRASGMLVLSYKSEQKGKYVSSSIQLVWDIQHMSEACGRDMFCTPRDWKVKFDFTL